ncbi:MAG: polysaccharide pyruvyl transferase family protein, partial [Floccifex sp.]
TANYGAVLQAFALQRFLAQRGHEVYIIDYIPRTINQKLLKVFCTKNIATIPVRVQNYVKFCKLNKFINKNMVLSNRYSTNEQLKKNPPQYDIYISGSDQIWNKFFTLQGEGEKTFTYYLDFVPQGKTKISYATSLGFRTADETYLAMVKPYWERYSAISVREESARELLKSIGISAEVLPDPTLLLPKEIYSKIACPEHKCVVCYILHQQQYSAQKLGEWASEKYFDRFYNITNCGIEEWLGYIGNAELVITNSYHGMIFSVLFHRNFIYVPVEGQGEEMNDRAATLLSLLDLEDRIVYDCNQIETLSEKIINWEKTDEKLNLYRKKGIEFLNNCGI